MKKLIFIFLIISKGSFSADYEFNPQRYQDNFILSSETTASHECYKNGNLSAPQRCVSEFINAAFNREVVTSNTCGINHPSEYCSQISLHGTTKICSVCDTRVPVSVYFKWSFENVFRVTIIQPNS